MTNHFTLDFSLIECLPIVKPNEPPIISGTMIMLQLWVLTTSSFPQVEPPVSVPSQHRILIPMLIPSIEIVQTHFTMLTPWIDTNERHYKWLRVCATFWDNSTISVQIIPVDLWRKFIWSSVKQNIPTVIVQIVLNYSELHNDCSKYNANCHTNFW